MTDRARILVVDDEMGPRESLRMILKPRHDIATADSGEAALRTLKTFHPDLIFMDIKMPQMDGIELLRRIKRIDQSIEVVMITAYASLETVKNALTHGAFEYLIKPFSRQDLEETVRRALARRQTEMGTRNQLTSLVDEMRALAGKTRDLEEEARREQAEQSLRVTQLSILREISRGLLGQLDLTQLIATITEQLRGALGYDEVRIHLGSAPGESLAGATAWCVRSGTTAPPSATSPPPTRRAPGPSIRASESCWRCCRTTSPSPSATRGCTARSPTPSARWNSSSSPPATASSRWTATTSWWAGIRPPSACSGCPPATPWAAHHRAAAPGAVPAARAALSPRVARARLRGASRRDETTSLNLVVTLSALTGRDGQIEGMLAIVHDTTAQRELEAQMLQSEKLTALGQMAGGIAHDFNNLLQAILGYAQLMGKNPANVDVVRRGLDVIEAAATGGAETVRRIQKFARLRPDEPFVSLDLNSVVNDAVAITQPRWEERSAKGGLPLRMELKLPPIPAGWAARELNEVVTNLILNAIDAMPAGGTLTIRTHVERGDTVVLTVSDTGTGMPEAVRKRVFDPFFTTKGEAGTGLGLSVSYSIVKRHNGEMRVDSLLGRGTTFTIVLPVASRPRARGPPGPRRAGQPPGTDPARGQRRPGPVHPHRDAEGGGARRDRGLERGGRDGRLPARAPSTWSSPTSAWSG